ncbi:GntR family transcriptional regulator [Clostridium sp.]|uniref:GntR family transcriptional regulator n=1 Tax=Clostridium sp. TaxID=1506 RepID=UPI003F4140B0
MIDKNSPIPVYYQLKNDLTKKIAEGVWGQGECIASERELCEIYEVSRMTIRQAIGELVQEGILLRVKGKGTFVCDQTVKQQDMMSFTEIIKQTGRKLETEVIEFEIIDTPENLMETFQLNKLYKINRKRIVDGECIAIEKVCIPVDYCGNLNRDMLKGSLYKILEEFGYIIDHTKSSVASVLMTDEYRRLFNVKNNVPLLKMIGKTFNQNGKILFLEESIYRSDKFILQVNISRREGKIK